MRWKNSRLPCLCEKHQPERPVRGSARMRQAAPRAGSSNNFPGEVAYAYKANSSVFLLGALYGAGITQFDVASRRRARGRGDHSRRAAALHASGQVAPRHPQAYFDLRHQAASRSTARTSCRRSSRRRERRPARTSSCSCASPCRRRTAAFRSSASSASSGQKAAKLLVKTRQVADELGITFHVGSQTTTPDAYAMAFEEVHKLIVKAGVVVDAHRRRRRLSRRAIPTASRRRCRTSSTSIKASMAKMPVTEHCRLICEPGRALVAEAESLIVRVDLRNAATTSTSTTAAMACCSMPRISASSSRSGSIRDGLDPNEPLVPFEFWGPTCDSIDHMKGPFLLPASMREGDYIEIGNIGAYGRAHRRRASTATASMTR